MPSADLFNNSGESSQMYGPNLNSDKRVFDGCKLHVYSTKQYWVSINPHSVLASTEPERKRRKKSRWGAEETDKTLIPGMPTVLPTNLSKEQEEAYVCEYNYRDYPYLNDF